MKKLSLIMLAVFSLLNILLAENNNFTIDKNNSEPLAKLEMKTIMGVPLVELDFQNGKKGTFIFDTGFDDNIIDSKFTEQVNLKIENPEKILQPGGYLEMGEISSFVFSIGGLFVKNLSAQSAPISQLSKFLGAEFHGILGHTFIEKYIIILDYKNQEMRIYDSSFEVDLSNYRIVPTTIVENEVLLPFSIQQENGKIYSDKIKLDTGSMGGLGFALNFYEDANLEISAPNYIKTTGIGGGGETEDRLFNLDKLMFAEKEYYDCMASVTIEAAGTERRTNAGTIGAKILAKQELVLDYPNNRILLGEEYDENVGLPNDKSGLWLIDSDNKKVVFTVGEGTPAEVAGIEPNDVVLEINQIKAENLSLEDVMRSFTGKIGTEVKLKIERNEIKKTISLVLHDLF